MSLFSGTSRVAATSSDDILSGFLVTGSVYHIFNCEQLSTLLKDSIKKERELKEMILKVGPIAAVVGGYQTDYLIEHGNIAAIHRELADKECSKSPARSEGSSR